MPWQVVVVMVIFASILDLDEIQVVVVGEEEVVVGRTWWWVVVVLLVMMVMKVVIRAMAVPLPVWVSKSRRRRQQELAVGWVVGPVKPMVGQSTLEWMVGSVLLLHDQLLCVTSNRASRTRPRRILWWLDWVLIVLWYR
jgi:hypothetical protein